MHPPVFSRNMICNIAIVSVSTDTAPVRQTVSAAPTTPIWTTRISQAILDQTEEGGCVSFWDENGIGVCTIKITGQLCTVQLVDHVHLSIWPNLNELFDPLFRHKTCIWPARIEVIIGLS
jgi:hypothetical protein